MPVPNEITATHMSQLFASGECNGQGSRHVIDGALIRVMPCKCVTCESGKEARRQAKERAYQEGIAKGRRILDGIKSSKTY